MKQLFKILLSISFGVFIMFSVLFMVKDRGTIALDLSPMPKTITLSVNEIIFYFFSAGLIIALIMILPWSIKLKIECLYLRRKASNLQDDNKKISTESPKTDIPDNTINHPQKNTTATSIIPESTPTEEPPLLETQNADTPIIEPTTRESVAIEQATEEPITQINDNDTKYK